MRLLFGTHQFLYCQRHNVLAGLRVFRRKHQRIQLRTPFCTHKAGGNCCTKARHIVAACDKQLVTGAPLLVGKYYGAQSADDAQTQKQVLQLARHSLRRCRIEETAPLNINVAVPLPHAADKQRNLCIGEGEDRRWNLLGARILAQDAQGARPLHDPGLPLTVSAPGVHVVDPSLCPN